MPRHIPALLVLVGLAACNHERPPGPLGLLTERTLAGGLAMTGTISTGGDARAALLESAGYAVRLPTRALLTCGVGSAWAGEGEAPGWIHVAVRADGRTLSETKLNPRAAHGFRDLSLPLEGHGGTTTLEFELRFTDRWDHPIPQPAGLLIGVSEPTLHDLDDYGRARGIVLISIDTLRRDHVGAYGYRAPTTPRLDALARAGLMLEDAVSTSSWTLPAHLSMMTSVDPGSHGGVDMEHGYNGKVPTLASLLREAGFATQAVTSHLYVSSVYGFDSGFDHLDFRQDRKATEVADRALALLDRIGDRPFFLFLHFYDPHWHYDPPERTRALFESGYTGTLSGNWRDFSQRQHLTPQDLAHLLALYDGEIRYTDDEVGRVLDHVRARGLDRGTLLAVTSDHGEEFLDHGSWEHQKTLYEEVVRIPMVWAGPGVPVRRETRQATLLDVLPTVLGWAGVTAKKPSLGRNLFAASEDRETFGETDHTTDGNHKLFLRAGSGRWKAIFSLNRDGSRVQSEEWYDLAFDPGEKTNAPPTAAAAEVIRKRALDRWRLDRGRGASSRAVHLSAEERERLKSLGYVLP